MISTGIFVATAVVWVGCMVFVYKHIRKDDKDGKDGEDGKNGKDDSNGDKDVKEEKINKLKPNSLVENFREPIFPNKQKLWCDNYPRSNGSIYGEASHLMSGYPYYDKAY